MHADAVNRNIKSKRVSKYLKASVFVIIKNCLPINTALFLGQYENYWNKKLDF